MRDIEVQFTAAFEAYADELFRHATLRLSDRERAVELTQETFLKAWDYVARGQEIREFRPFFYRTLRNLIIDEYRKHKTTSLEGLIEGDDGETIDALLPADDTDVLEEAVVRFDGARALAALKDLPDTYREVLSLRYVDGLSPKEIAHVLGESENVVSVRIHRGLKKLRIVLEPPQQTHD